jgi:hypothetical protein
MNILTSIYPTNPIACGTTYASIILYPLGTPVVPEQVISSKYTEYTLKYNLGILRRERNIRLAPTDMYGLVDFPFPSAENKQAWLAYRQSLRNITTVYPAPEVDADDKLMNVVWPTPPSK